MGGETPIRTPESMAPATSVPESAAVLAKTSDVGRYSHIPLETLKQFTDTSKDFFDALRAGTLNDVDFKNGCDKLANDFPQVMDTRLIDLTTQLRDTFLEAKKLPRTADGHVIDHENVIDREGKRFFGYPDGTGSVMVTRFTKGEVTEADLAKFMKEQLAPQFQDKAELFAHVIALELKANTLAAQMPDLFMAFAQLLGDSSDPKTHEYLAKTVQDRVTTETGKVQLEVLTTSMVGQRVEGVLNDLVKNFKPESETGSADANRASVETAKKTIDEVAGKMARSGQTIAIRDVFVTVSEKGFALGAVQDGAQNEPVQNLSELLEKRGFFTVSPQDKDKLQESQKDPFAKARESVTQFFRELVCVMHLDQKPELMKQFFETTKNLFPKDATELANFKDEKDFSQKTYDKILEPFEKIFFASGSTDIEKAARSKAFAELFDKGLRGNLESSYTEAIKPKNAVTTLTEALGVNGFDIKQFIEDLMKSLSGILSGLGFTGKMAGDRLTEYSATRKKLDDAKRADGVKVEIPKAGQSAEFVRQELVSRSTMNANKLGAYDFTKWNLMDTYLAFQQDLKLTPKQGKDLDVTKLQPGAVIFTSTMDIFGTGGAGLDAVYVVTEAAKGENPAKVKYLTADGSIKESPLTPNDIAGYRPNALYGAFDAIS